MKNLDTVTWLRAKHPETYTIHFDLFRASSSSFSFELFTSGEVIHFSEHNPKRDINLMKDENCILMIEDMSRIITTGSNIYVYYNM